MISSTKKSIGNETDLIYRLIQCGYSETKAVNLYNKYKNWGKLNKLKEYVDEKLSLSNEQNIESYPLHDM